MQWEVGASLSFFTFEETHYAQSQKKTAAKTKKPDAISALATFVDYLNTGTSFYNWSLDTLDRYLVSLRQTSLEFYTDWEDPEAKQSRILRASTLGQPSVIQAMKVLGYDRRTPSEGTENRLSRLFMDGHVFEAELVAHLESYPDFVVEDQQREIEFEKINGHIDCVVNTGAGRVLVEAKTMSPYYWEKFRKSPDDERGYMTQLAIYTETLGLPGVWLAKNKATSEVAMIIPNEEDLIEARHRAHLLVPMLRKIETFEDVYSVFVPPDPVEEVCRKQLTGRLVLPNEMRYSAWRGVFYDLETRRDCYSKFKEYVVQVSSMEHAKAKLEEKIKSS